MTTRLTIIGIILLAVLGMFLPCWVAAQEKSTPAQDDTMLMFVGEDLEVLTIASRRQESAWQAPAIAEVITRRQLEERGIRTLSQALEQVPGFYMAQREMGSQPYLRGIADSVLFLYDTTPLGADSSKSYHPIDYEISLAPIKRVEVIRGPGSVLWGPDAFGGVVNAVPMTGKDQQGVETGVLYKNPEGQGAGYMNMGHDGGNWDAFLSLSFREGDESDSKVNLVRFFGDGTPVPVAPAERAGDEDVEPSRYFEASGRIALEDWLTFSGRISDFKKPYALTRSEQDLTWQESRAAAQSHFKLEAKKKLDPNAALRFTGYYSLLEMENKIIDSTYQPEEATVYGEMIYDRSFLAGRSLLTLGLSYREKNIKGAPIWEAYLPDFLGADNLFFLPSLKEEDYRTKLCSLFSQYNHKIDDFDFFLGLRYDEHDQYEDHLSYNAGLVWSGRSDWSFKLLYGTAYRTPFARQLLGGTPFSRQPADPGKSELEKIETLSAQLAWNPSRRAGVSLVGFFSRIENHIMEDPFGGLSLPNEQDIPGVEIEAHLSPFRELDLSANFTLLQNRGPDETYRFVESFFLRPDGTVEEVVAEQMFPYDIGAERIFNLLATWRPSKRFSVFGRLAYLSSRELIYPQAETFDKVPGVWLADLAATWHNVGGTGFDLNCSISNLTDREYDTPGTYTAVEGEPFSVSLRLTKKW